MHEFVEFQILKIMDSVQVRIHLQRTSHPATSRASEYIFESLAGELDVPGMHEGILTLTSQRI